MIAVQQDFDNRVAEIDAYLEFINQVENGSLLPTSTYSTHDQANLLRTFKASAFLLLYNLMESAVANAIQAIFDELERQGTSLDSCRQEVRRVVLGNLKQFSIDKLLDMNSFAVEVIAKTFKKDDIVSGNVDARKIRDMAKEYGFRCPPSDGRDLLVVKTTRNDLAHGGKSFAEVGRDYTIADIVEIKRKVIKYLNEMLSCVSDYIANQSYLIATA